MNDFNPYYQPESYGYNQQEDYIGKPMYGLNQYAIDTNSIRPEDEKATWGSMKEAAGKGFAGGSALGGAVGSAVYGPVGAALGSIGWGVMGAEFGAVSNLVGSRYRRRRAERRRNKMSKTLEEGQSKYNQAALTYNQNQTAMTLNNNNMNKQSRMYSLYNRGNLYA